MAVRSGDAERSAAWARSWPGNPAQAPSQNTGGPASDDAAGPGQSHSSQPFAAAQMVKTGTRYLVAAAAARPRVAHPKAAKSPYCLIDTVSALSM